MFSAHEIVEIKSFFIVSAVAISEAIEFMESGKLYRFHHHIFSILTSRFPPEISFFCLLCVISFKGITMELMKKRFGSSNSNKY